jgi:NIMA (never in mitosis gene a)-related kinase
MEAYVELQTIGRGSQGTVCTVRHVAEGAIYLMKRLHVVEHRARRAALREAQYLQLLQHTAVVGYRDCFIHEDSLCIVMEYVRCADAYGQGPPYCTYGLRAPAPSVLYVPAA